MSDNEVPLYLLDDERKLWKDAMDARLAKLALVLRRLAQARKEASGAT